MQLSGFIIFWIVFSLTPGDAASESSAELDDWLNGFFYRLGRRLPDGWKDYLFGYEWLAAIEDPGRIGASHGLGVILDSKESCASQCRDDNKTRVNVAYATHKEGYGRYFSAECMILKDDFFHPLAEADRRQDTVELLRKGVMFYRKFFPALNSEPKMYFDDEIEEYVRSRQDAGRGKASEIEEEMRYLQFGDDAVDRTLEEMYEEAAGELERRSEEEKEAKSKEADKPVLEAEDGPDERKINDDVTTSEQPPNEPSDETYIRAVERSTTESGETDADENNHDEEPRSRLPDGEDSYRSESHGRAVNYVDDGYKVKYKTVVSILIALLVFLALIVLIYVYRRQRNSRVLHVSRCSSPGKDDERDGSIFEPKFSPAEKVDLPSGRGLTLTVTAPGSRGSSVSSLRSNPFQGEIPKLLPPPSTPNSRTASISAPNLTLTPLPEDRLSQRS